MTETRPAFYALASGGWRDYWTLLHPPYTAWHLSYVAIGAALAPDFSLPWLVESLIAFLLAMGVTAHALDELQGRPLGTRIGDGTLWLIAIVSLGAAIALGIHGMLVVSPWLGVFITAGAFIVVAYNLELFDGRFHSTTWFAVAWAAFPALTGYFAQAGSLSLAAAVVAGACALSAVAQRRLSTPVRDIRRRTARVTGTVRRSDGSTEAIDAATLTEPAEGALRALSLGLPLLALGMVLGRLI